MDNPDLIEKYELELMDKAYEMHKDISYKSILFIFQAVIKNLDTMNYSERALSGIQE